MARGWAKLVAPGGDGKVDALRAGLGVGSNGGHSSGAAARVFELTERARATPRELQVYFKLSF